MRSRLVRHSKASAGPAGAGRMPATKLHRIRASTPASPAQCKLCMAEGSRVIRTSGKRHRHARAWGQILMVSANVAEAHVPREDATA